MRARNFACPLPLRVEKMDATQGHIVIDGNTAAALGCVYAGATVGAWYPITPSTSLMDAFKSFCDRLRVDADTGRKNYIMIQAEDELASIGMVIGANWNGARAFTATSGPGISLMQEFLGLAYYAEVPAVIFDVQRVGPSTGMPTRTQQSDLKSAAYASHGDTRQVCLYPANPEECFEFAATAFDMADRLQTPVLVLSDLDIGMNDWMCPEFKWDENYRPDRGKMLDSRADREARQVLALLRHRSGRHPAAHAAGHRPQGRLLHARLGTQSVRRLHRGFQGISVRGRSPAQEVADGRAAGAEAHHPAPQQPTDIAIVSLGSGDGAVHEAQQRLRANGIHADYMRIRSFPFNDEVDQFLQAHRINFVVEQNRDAQLRSMLIMETGVEKTRLRSILHYNGMPIPASYVFDGVMSVVVPQRPVAQRVV